MIGHDVSPPSDGDAETFAPIVTLETARRRKTRFVPAPDDPRPTIRIIPGEIEVIVDKAEAALIAAGRPLYQRDGRIVFVSDAIALTASGKKITVQRIAERGDYALVEDLAASAHFVRYDARARAEVPVDPPASIARTLRQRVGRLRLPILTGIINAPTLRADGSILSMPGYDQATGLLFDPQGVEFPAVPDRPSRDDALAALAALEDLISTFPFVRDVDRSVALSAMLTAPVRRSLSAAPLHASTAPVAGSGKSILVDLASIIATGKEAPVTAQGAKEEEFEKRLGALLMTGDPIIAIDNCSKPLGGDLLCQVLTQLTVKPRILGKSESPTCSTGAFVAANGNNLVLAGDVTRRAILCRLDPKCELPETRVFDRDPVAVAKAERPRLVAAVLTVLRAFHVAGRPRTKSPLGSFVDWCLIRDALMWLDQADPVDSMESVRKADPQLADLKTMIEQWRSAIGEERVTANEVIKRATETRQSDFRECLFVVAGNGGPITSRKLGDWLSANADRIANGHRFTKTGLRHGVAVWTLETGQRGG